MMNTKMGESPYAVEEILGVLKDQVCAGFSDAIASYMESLDSLRIYGYFISDARLLVSMELDEGMDNAGVLEFYWNPERNELTVELSIDMGLRHIGHSAVKDALVEHGFIKEE